MALLDDVGIGAVNKDDPQKQLESVVKQVNEHARAISNEDRTKIIKSDSGIETLTIGQLPTGGNGILVKDSNDVNRALFGEFPNGDIALKLSQAGVDVTSATDDQLIWSTDFNSFKIVDKGSTSITLANPATQGAYTSVVTHNLGYRPVVFAFLDTPAVIGSALQVPLPYVFYIYGVNHALEFSPRLWVSYEHTSVNALTFYVVVNGASLYDGTTWGFTYYLLRETAN